MSGAARGARAIALAGVCSALLGLLRSAPAQAQGEGPRAYELGPTGSQLLSIYGLFTRGNASFTPGSVAAGLDVEVNGSIIEYSRGFALAGNAGTWAISLPLGEARWRVESAGAAYSYTRSGAGDLQLTAAFGAVGSPALQEKDYEAYHPGFALNVLSRVYVPTGAYDRSAPVNLGQNRWSLQLGVPLAWYLGHSFLDPTLTTFELLPSVTWYGDNNEPHVGNRVSQDPLGQLEAHVTRNLNSSLWVSLDGLLMLGGETTTDGVSDHNRQRSIALGATVSLAVSDAVSAAVSYTDAVSRNNVGVSGHALRVVAEFSF